ncbi:HNH endonuclease [Cloacibacterium normanense]|uniref:HNH endonuclease n=1 Tax=Cloacibacterium normanense TaxID=237258 RepID=UPI00352EED18
MKNKKYQGEAWKSFRGDIIESDGFICSHCGRNSFDVVLQVHHTKYIKGRKLWEYAGEDCITLCRGCHAMEHGIIMPNYGWEYICDEDLGDLIGECERCGNNMRYAFHIYHEKWGSLQVGRQCCDNLTDSLEASNHLESIRRFESRKQNFIKSSKWKDIGNTHIIKKNLFEIKVEEIDKIYYLTIHGKRSTKQYHSLYEAKSSAFEVLENGKFIDYCLKHKIPLPPKFMKKE